MAVRGGKAMLMSLLGQKVRPHLALHQGKQLHGIVELIVSKVCLPGLRDYWLVLQSWECLTQRSLKQLLQDLLDGVQSVRWSRTCRA